MSYIDSNLLAGEEVVYRTKLHWSVFLCPGALFVLSFFISGPSAEAAAMGMIITLISIGWGVSAFIAYKSSEFAVTNKRLLIKTGFIRRNSLETLLVKVEGLQVDQGVLGRVLNYGTIRVTGTGGTSSPFKRIDAPLEFRKKIQGQISSEQK